MPPKKRKSVNMATTPVKTSAAHTNATPATAASSRSKRGDTTAAPEEPTPKKAKTTKKAPGPAPEHEPVNDAPKRGRGRPKKVVDQVEEEEAVEAPVAKRARGRPAKKTADAHIARQVELEAEFDDADADENEEQDEVKAAPKPRGRPPKKQVVEEPEPAPKKRGRPAKAKVVEEVEEEEDDDELQVPVPRGRGRPKKEKAEEPVQKPAPGKRGKKAKVQEAEESEVEAPVAKRPRGRPAKAKQTDEQPEPEAQNPAPKKRGRPAKAAATAATPKPRGRPPKRALDSAADDDDEPAAKQPKKTTKKASKPKQQPQEDSGSATSNEINPTEATTEIAVDSSHPTRSYWLMKAEPETRLETTTSGKVVDVKFSIDDLASRTSPEPWDGIRNAVASRNMREMHPGDLAFFYESNCKTPGIVGVMEIVREADVDASAFDEGSAYYDPKSNEAKPRWMNTFVEFRRKFSKVSLDSLKQYGKDDGPLRNMQVLKQTRLSVSKVSREEWEFVMSLVEDEEESALPAPAAKMAAVVEDAGDAVASALNGHGDGIEISSVNNDHPDADASVFDAVPSVASPSLVDGARDEDGLSIEAVDETPAPEAQGGLPGIVKRAFGAGGSRAGSAAPNEQNVAEQGGDEEEEEVVEDEEMVQEDGDEYDEDEVDEAARDRPWH